MRSRLLLLTGATTAVVLAVLLIPLGLLTRSHAEDRAMTDATERGQSVAAVVAGALGGGTGSSGTGPGAGTPGGQNGGAGGDSGRDGDEVIRGVLDGLNGTDQPRTSVVLPSGTVLGSKPQGVSAEARQLAQRGRAFTYAPESGGRVVMVPVLGGPGKSGQSTSSGGTGRPAIVQVSVSEQQLHAGVLPSWLAVAGLGVALILLGLAFADRLAARLVRSTRRLAGVADRLAGGDLEARAEPLGPPELKLVAGRLNELGERIGVLMEAERERAADVAHRLRTPVAALRLDAEGLRDQEEAARIGASVAALERSVDDVIRTARRAGAEPGSERGDLAAVARERADFWAPLAEDQGREVEVKVPEHAVPVPVSDEELSAVLDALIGNVLDHTPEGAALRVSVTDEGELAVADEGPGFPEGGFAERGTSGAGSTGLGLDIARRTAESVGGGVRLGAGPGGKGACVRCAFRPEGHRESHQGAG
ncbi:HAMP domain-containing sensor histidine kinase [Streptomyces sp. ODS28]|uniref:sensor histidine kinase n=1 Tax=Streptomyces sp. ODS28 TaxID=3136688 RepID=UPI0031F0CF91